MELPEGTKALPSHWVFKVKHERVSNVQCFKARVVCGGNHQIEGIDNQATYAPTARVGDVRLEHTIATKYNVEIYQMDVGMALLGVD